MLKRLIQKVITTCPSSPIKVPPISCGVCIHPPSISPPSPLPLFLSDEQRRIQEQRNSRKGWLRAWGALQNWMHQLFRIIVAFTEDPMFDKFILFVVVLNTGTLVAQTFESVTMRGGWFFSALDSAFLAIYLMECVLKLLVWGRLYFKNPWNDLGNFSGGQASTIFRILKLFKGVRAIRAFRVLRTIRFLQNLQSIVSTCLQSLQSMGAIIILMFTFLFMFAAVFREMFNESDPHRFGTMFRTIFTLFQLLTLDDWAFIYSTSRDNGAPHIIIFLVLYIVVEYFTFLNLFIAVLVDNFQMTIKRRMASKIQKFQDIYESEMQSMKKLEPQPIEPQTDEEFYEEALKLTYSENKYGKREIELITSYLRLLASIDQNQQTFRSQGCVLERLIDSFFEATEEDSQGNDHE
ncbi:cation channel sperm-associated protein 1-like isoform X3 [Salvelinus fontinalis]|uniref:cation channel sperm-associated protein 1-like isoform X3 n=1 Tax=Salvelinus fontinalis TaxID=8038 RepID=UPI0024865C15|nr:cation channel sperm-associated protein 1-like isoform X3 [Salvelinus fontinalis]